MKSFKKALEQLVDEHMIEYDRVRREAEGNRKNGDLDGPHIAELSALDFKFNQDAAALRKKYGR